MHTKHFSIFALATVVVSSLIAVVMILIAAQEPVYILSKVDQTTRVQTYLTDARKSILLSYDIEKAEKSYKKVLAVDPANEEALYELARVYLVEGKYPEALATATRFNAIYPNKTRILYIGGLIAGYSGNLPLSEQLFKNYIQNEKTANWQSRLDLSWALIQQGKYTDAEGLLTKELEAFPENPWLLNNTGVALLGQNKNTDAIVVLQKAVKSASALTDAEWTANYSFNNPAETKVSLMTFKNIVQYNLDKAKKIKTAIVPPGYKKIGALSLGGEEFGIAVSACGESCGPVLCTSPANACGQVSQYQVNSCLGQSCGSVGAPALPSGYGQSCTGTNSCGVTGTGVVGCDGLCRVVAGLPADYGSSCVIRNSCGSVSGRIGCDGTCATATAAPVCNDPDIVIVGDNTNDSTNTDITFGNENPLAVFARISAVPLLIHRGQTSDIKWQTQNTVSCTVTGNTGTVVDTWNFITGIDHRTSSPISRETPYTLTCKGKNGQTLTSSVTIRIVPDWQEI